MPIEKRDKSAAGGRGRPAIRDVAAIRLMIALQEFGIESGSPLSDRAVAERVSEMLPIQGASREAIAVRLRRKLREERRAHSTQDFCSNELRAREGKSKQEFSPLEESKRVFIGLLRDAEDAAERPAAAAPNIDKYIVENRATVRIVGRERHAQAKGGPRYMMGVRLKLSNCELIEFRLKPGAARDLAQAILAGLDALDRQHAPHASASGEAAND